MRSSTYWWKAELCTLFGNDMANFGQRMTRVAQNQTMINSQAK